MYKPHTALMAFGLGMLFATGSLAESDDAGALIKSMMGAEQYRAAGLEKLSTAERAALYEWLREFKGSAHTQIAPATNKIAPAAVTTSATTAGAAVANIEAPAPDSEPATQTAAAAPSQAGSGIQPSEKAIEENFGLPDPVDPEKATYQLHATIEEPFRGWSGKTVFYLDNGQVWKQRSKGQHTYTGSDNRVVISQNRFGFYEMRLIDADRSIGVKRIK